MNLFFTWIFSRAEFTVVIVFTYLFRAEFTIPRLEIWTIFNNPRIGSYYILFRRIAIRPRLQRSNVIYARGARNGGMIVTVRFM
jgi:hypothetical protein